MRRFLLGLLIAVWVVAAFQASLPTGVPARVEEPPPPLLSEPQPAVPVSVQPVQSVDPAMTAAMRSLSAAFLDGPWCDPTVPPVEREALLAGALPSLLGSRSVEELLGLWSPLSERCGQLIGWPEQESLLLALGGNEPFGLVYARREGDGWLTSHPRWPDGHQSSKRLRPLGGWFPDGRLSALLAAERDGNSLLLHVRAGAADELTVEVMMTTPVQARYDLLPDPSLVLVTYSGDEAPGLPPGHQTLFRWEKDRYTQIGSRVYSYPLRTLALFWKALRARDIQSAVQLTTDSSLVHQLSLPMLPQYSAPYGVSLHTIAEQERLNWDLIPPLLRSSPAQGETATAQLFGRHLDVTLTFAPSKQGWLISGALLYPKPTKLGVPALSPPAYVTLEPGVARITRAVLEQTGEPLELATPFQGTPIHYLEPLRMEQSQVNGQRSSVGHLLLILSDGRQSKLWVLTPEGTGLRVGLTVENGVLLPEGEFLLAHDLADPSAPPHYYRYDPQVGRYVQLNLPPDLDRKRYALLALAHLPLQGGESVPFWLMRERGDVHPPAAVFVEMGGRMVLMNRANESDSGLVGPSWVRNLFAADLDQDGQIEYILEGFVGFHSSGLFVFQADPASGEFVLRDGLVAEYNITWRRLPDGTMGFVTHQAGRSQTEWVLSQRTYRWEGTGFLLWLGPHRIR